MLQHFQIFESISNSTLLYLKNYLCWKMPTKTLCKPPVVIWKYQLQCHCKMVCNACNKMLQALWTWSLFRKWSFFNDFLQWKAYLSVQVVQKKWQSNLTGKSNSPSHAQVVNCTFFAIHQSGMAWALGILTFFTVQNASIAGIHCQLLWMPEIFVFLLVVIEKTMRQWKVFLDAPWSFSWCKLHQIGSFLLHHNLFA